MNMIAKFKVVAVNDQPGATHLSLMAVSEKPFDAEGNSDDNTFARWTPCGKLDMSITNPALLGQFKPEQKFYLSFSEASS